MGWDGMKQDDRNSHHSSLLVTTSFVTGASHRRPCSKILDYITRHDKTWHDMTWHDMTWHDMTWHDMTWYEIVSHRLLHITGYKVKDKKTCYRLVRGNRHHSLHHTTSHRIASRCVVQCVHALQKREVTRVRSSQVRSGQVRSGQVVLI